MKLLDRMNGVSKEANKIPVLTSLKQCVKKIENEVGDLKHSFNAITFDFTNDAKNDSLYLAKRDSIKKQITCLQHECQKLKSSWKKNIEETKCYFLDMEENILDLEDEVDRVEEHLINYGYNPSELDSTNTHESTPEVHSSESDEIPENDLSMTPEFDIPSLSLRSKESGKEETTEDKPSTPELKVEVYEPERKSRHVLSSPLPYPNIGSASKLGDVARRLYF